MTRYRLRCPDCRRAFAWDDTSALPDYCPLCGSYVGLETPPDGRFEPKAPAIGRKRSADAVYRGIEEGSANAAKAAAEILGVPESETAHMRVTNMRDGLREGDIAAVSRPNPVSTFMQQNPAVVSNAQANALAYESGTRSGPYPRAGDRTRQMIGGMHQQIRAAVEQQGRMNRN